MFAQLFERIKSIESISQKESFVEKWNVISFCGFYDPHNSIYFEGLDSELAKLEIGNSVNYFVGNVKCQNIQEFINDIQQNDEWKININKNVLLSKSINDKNFNNYLCGIIWIYASDEKFQ